MLSDVLVLLQEHGLKPAGVDRWMSRCPAHDDRTASLSIARGTSGRTLLKCHAGCTSQEVVSALGTQMGALFEEDDRAREESLPPERWPVVGEHVYHDDRGTPLMRVLKRRSPDSGAKTFRQERWQDGQWRSGVAGVTQMPYRLTRLVDKELCDDTVWVVEGEKDADALEAIGLLATTNAGGAGKWTKEHAKWLKGRDVVVLPDNDEPGEKHAAAVVASLDKVAENARILRLPNLPNKGDVSDWLGAGGTEKQLRLLAEKAAQGARFMPSSRRLIGEREERLALARHRLSFGVGFLDKALGGINRRDLVLIGAKTGIGKTAMAATIAMHNAAKGKRVHAFLLEAEDREMERRVKYRMLANAYYEKSMYPRQLRYIDWYNGDLEDVLGPYERDVEKQLDKAFENISTYYRGSSFTAEDFEQHLQAIQEETDLVVLDHFHFFDSDDDNETRAQRARAKKIRDCALLAERPVVMVGHVRKTDGKGAPMLLPSSDDFHGSADLARIPTKIVMIAPDHTEKTGDITKWFTFMQVTKCRQESVLTRYTARLTYDIQREEYEQAFQLGRLIDNGREFELLQPDEVPAWAKEHT